MLKEETAYETYLTFLFEMFLKELKICLDNFLMESLSGKVNIYSDLRSFSI